MTYEEIRAQRRQEAGKPPLDDYRAPSVTQDLDRGIGAAEAMNKAVAAERMRAWSPHTAFR